MPVLEARGIVKALGAGRAQRRILDGVDLDVEAGEVVAVLGRSGSGKSTLLHLLGGLDHPDQGRIVLSGREITRQSPRALVNDPELVLADEPTGNLDQENGATVLALLRNLRRRAVVIVTLEPEAAGLADRVLLLSDGKLAPEGVALRESA